jgi:hypothetical protein
MLLALLMLSGTAQTERVEVAATRHFLFYSDEGVNLHDELSTLRD